MKNNRRICLLLLSCGLGAGAWLCGSEPDKKQKVAEGQYKYLLPTAAREELDENWILYRTSQGYLVESHGEWIIEGEKVGFDVGRYWLSRDLVLVRWEMELHSRQDEQVERFGCELSPRQLRCWDESGEGTLAVSEPYEVFTLAPSVWPVMSLIRRSGLTSTGQTARVQVVFWDLADGPSDLTSSYLEITRLSAERIRVSDKEFDAHKFQLENVCQAPGETGLVLVAPEGIVLGVRSRDESEPAPGEESFRLIRYTKYAEFGQGR